ncbi:OmpA family protein [Spongiimicrobium sp. 3-5]|uniref:OmpA family protein n=1 Tax=Spongiimicrobium sp. 3-5 TaxID=3332596 RepID=UPI00397FFC2D
MKNIIFKGTSILMVFAMIASCNTVKNANNTQKGAAIGAVGGAVIGGLLSKKTAVGAIIGGVVGGAAGGYIGNRMDRQAERIESEVPGAEVTRVGEGINVTFDENSGVYFDTNKAEIKGTAATTLQRLAGVFKEYPNSNILVEGHTDSSGSDTYNMTLSQKRAEAVTSYLASQGVSIGRFDTKWYGESQPREDNGTPEGRAKNRRVELAIVANETLKQEAISKTN